MFIQILYKLLYYIQIQEAITVVHLVADSVVHLVADSVVSILRTMEATANSVVGQMLEEFQTDKAMEIAEEGPSTTEVEVMALDIQADLVVSILRTLEATVNLVVCRMLAEFQMDKATEIAEEGPSATEMEALALDMEVGSSEAESADILPELEVGMAPELEAGMAPESVVDTPLAPASLTDMASVPTIISENSYLLSFAHTTYTPSQFLINSLVQIH
jgi:xanthine/CO dehydrogenase XdhC/CoxF family maturation factor